MPWALNEATRTISPTKTLEYMAGGKPIVSTAVLDVVRDHGDLVSIADGPARFRRQGPGDVGDRPIRRRPPRGSAEARAAESGWNPVAHRDEGAEVEAGASGRPSQGPARRLKRVQADDVKSLIVGGGPAGLSAGLSPRRSPTSSSPTSTTGPADSAGRSSSDGFTFDYAGTHLLHARQVRRQDVPRHPRRQLPRAARARAGSISTTPTSATRSRGTSSACRTDVDQAMPPRRDRGVSARTARSPR